MTRKVGLMIVNAREFHHHLAAWVAPFAYPLERPARGRGSYQIFLAEMKGVAVIIGDDAVHTTDCARPSNTVA